MLCIGHRGAMGHEPENTLLSVKKALSLGVDWIEVDVYNVEDNLIVFHDRLLDRTTNGTGYTANQTFAYIRSLDAGKGEQVPTLSEVFDVVAQQVVINIELKGSHTATLVANLIKSYIDQGWSKDCFFVSSFDHYELAKFKALCPQIPIGIIIYGLPLDYLAIAQKLKATAIIAAIDFTSPELVKTSQHHGFKLLVYTVNHPRDIEQMRNLNVDGIFTNYPERVVSG